MKNILITGGLGFIGANLSRKLLEDGNRVICIDNLTTNIIAPEDTFLKSFPNFDFHQIDLACMQEDEKKLIEELIASADLIYHMASSVGVRHIDMNPQGTLHNNFYMSAQLFPIFEKHGKKVVYASSSEVYGEKDGALETDSFNIGSPDVLRGGYACHKAMNEFLLYSYSFPFVIARFFNVTGKGQTGKHGMVLPRFIAAAKEGKNLAVYDDGSQTRSFCDIRDAIEMLKILGESDEHNDEIYNIGNEANTVSIKELAELVRNFAKSDLSIEYTPYREVFSKHSLDIRNRFPNTQKMQKHYKCRYNLNEILTTMLEDKK